MISDQKYSLIILIFINQNSCLKTYNESKYLLIKDNNKYKNYKIKN